MPRSQMSEVWVGMLHSQEHKKQGIVIDMKAAVAEFVAMTLFVVFGCGVACANGATDGETRLGCVSRNPVDRHRLRGACRASSLDGQLQMCQEGLLGSNIACHSCQEELLVISSIRLWLRWRLRCLSGSPVV